MPAKPPVHAVPHPAAHHAPAPAPRQRPGGSAVIVPHAGQPGGPGLDWSAQIARAFADYAAVIEAEQRHFERTMAAADAMFAQAQALGNKAYNDIAVPAADAYTRARDAAETAQDAILGPARATYAAILARAQDVHDANLDAARSAYQRALSNAQDAYTALTSEPARPA